MIGAHTHTLSLSLSLTHTHTHTHTWKTAIPTRYVCIYTRTCTHIPHTYNYIYIVCTCTCTCTQTYPYMYISTYMYIYIYIHNIHVPHLQKLFNEPREYSYGRNSKFRNLNGLIKKQLKKANDISRLDFKIVYTEYKVTGAMKFQNGDEQ